MQLPNAGNHTGQLNGAMRVWESEKGALFVLIPVTLVNSEISWHGTHYYCIGKKDGTLIQRAVQDLREIFPDWDGKNPFDLEQRAQDETQFDLVCEHEDYVPENSEDGQPVTSFKIKFMNPLGGGASRMPEALDETQRKAVLAKWGGKFRATAGTIKVAPKATPEPEAEPAAAEPEPAQEAAPAAAKPATKAAAKKAAPPAKPAPPAAPAGKKAQTAGGQPATATMEEAWESCVNANEGKSQDELGTIWYAAIEAAKPGGSETQNLSIQEWGKVKQGFGA